LSQSPKESFGQQKSNSSNAAGKQKLNNKRKHKLRTQNLEHRTQNTELKTQNSKK